MRRTLVSAPRARRATAALAVCFLVNFWTPPLAAEDQARDWPQYRGVGRDGLSAEVGLPASWPEGGPRVVWRRAIGPGFSGIAVSGGRLFTMFAEGGEEHAAAFDAASGEEVWRRGVGKEIASEFGNGPRSTPTVGGDLVYFLSSDGRLAALAAADGKERWAVDLKSRFGAVQPQHGFSTAPMLEGDVLLVEVGGGLGEAYAALDPASGEVRWTALDGAASYSSPIAVALDGRQQLIAIGGGQIVGLDTGGRTTWSHPWGGGIAMPLWIAPDQLFVSSPEAGSMLLRLSGAAGGEPRIEEVWKNGEMRNHFNSSVVHAGYVYGFDNATLKCISAATGERQWAKRGLGRGSLILADGRLLILGERGELVQAVATPEEFREEGSVQALDGKCWTSPTLAGGRLYLRNLSEMVSFELKG